MPKDILLNGASPLNFNQAPSARKQKNKIFLKIQITIMKSSKKEYCQGELFEPDAQNETVFD